MRMIFHLRGKNMYLGLRNKQLEDIWLHAQPQHPRPRDARPLAFVCADID